MQTAVLDRRQRAEVSGKIHARGQREDLQGHPAGDQDAQVVCGRLLTGGRVGIGSKVLQQGVLWNRKQPLRGHLQLTPIPCGYYPRHFFPDPSLAQSCFTFPPLFGFWLASECSASLHRLGIFSPCSPGSATVATICYREPVGRPSRRRTEDMGAGHRLGTQGT